MQVNDYKLFQKKFDEKLSKGDYTHTVKEDADVQLDFLKEKLDYAKRLGKIAPEDVIQAWNGYGRVKAGLYGSKDSIDMAKNPVYGKRVLDIIDNILKKNPEIVKMIENVKKQ